uniref:Large ribosomal subunit protein uL29c n=1 Tax=Actinocyclus sp. (in: diatoms) TaxID=1923973 RepID=A0A9E8Y9P9_9STRA|nr:ribosomal protein L29 [Actinocyclus sp. (in: diatoms)]
MGISRFTDIISFSNNEISNAIIKTEKELFNLRFKKATRQSFKSHEIKEKKRQLAHLKTILTLRLKSKTKQYIDKTS